MAEDFADWFEQWLRDNPDPLTGRTFTNARAAELMGYSMEKVHKWRARTRTPAGVEDVRNISRFTGRPQAEILEKLGYDVVAPSLLPSEREMLTAFQRLSPWPDRQDIALGLIQSMYPKSVLPQRIARAGTRRDSIEPVA